MDTFHHPPTKSFSHPSYENIIIFESVHLKVKYINFFFTILARPPIQSPLHFVSQGNFCRTTLNIPPAAPSKDDNDKEYNGQVIPLEFFSRLPGSCGWRGNNYILRIFSI